MKSVVIFLLALVVSTLGQNCGPAACYSGCTNPDVPLDLIFLIDVSGSMQPVIDGVISGVTQFVSNLLTLNVVPWYNVITFGDQYNEALVVLNAETSFATFKQTIDAITTNGAWEPSLETIRRVCNKANAGNFNLNLRSGSTRTIILLTNEDSDPAYFNANLYQTQSGNANHECPTSYYEPYTSTPPPNWSQWQAEINATVAAVQSIGASTYLMLSVDTSSEFRTSQTCLTNIQLGDYNLQSQNSDYSGFSISGTLQNLENAGLEPFGSPGFPYTLSLQALLLKSGQLSRAFNVALTDNSNLIANFFQAIVVDISQCNHTCYNYPCSTTSPSTCLPPVDICGCDGVPNSGATLDPNKVCCLASQKDCLGYCFGTGKLDPCGVCTAGGALDANCKQDCNGNYYLTSSNPPYHKDSCGNCIPYSQAESTNCVQGCNGAWTTPSNAYFYDNCGACVAPGSNPNANKDACGVCFGNVTAEQNQCGVCFGTKAIDACKNPVCKNITCNLQCDGTSVSNGQYTVYLDPCGDCVAIGTISPQCLKDCAGNYYKNGTTPAFHKDECGDCIQASITRSANCVQDCNGTWNGTAYYDQCHQCVVNNSPKYNCTTDCAGNLYLQGLQTPNYTIDACGVCNTAANQNIEIDKCGVCTNKPGYNSTAQCTPDCHNVYTLPNSANRSILDACGDCWWPNQTKFINYNMDDCGVCYSSRNATGWNSEVTYDSQGNRCACYEKPHSCPTANGGTVMLCIDCPSFNNCSTGVPDSCGLCPGNSMYGKKDQCGLCCNPQGGIPCNVDVDECGVCFGFNKQKSLNPCHICNSSLCHVDCKGVANGTAVYGCDGVCDSNATCSYCGNGVVDAGEQCDYGNSTNGTPGSKCGANCQWVKNTISTGSIVGAVVGSVAGAAFLGAAGFFAYKYAEKNGLIGNAGKKVDMGASNSNPLYKGETNIQQNPLYGK